MSAPRSSARWVLVLALRVLAFMAVAARLGPDRKPAIPAAVGIGGAKLQSSAEKDGELEAGQAGADRDWWSSISQQLAAEECQKRLMEILSQMPKQQRQALMLREVSGFDEEETAAVLGTTADQVKDLTNHARAMLRKRLADAAAED